ncbi:ribosomal protein S18-alanine N-acetyltransferase [Cryptosporangium sp. NPDC051539]|uniref:ribosomal protein S18-alanine N-acetyltransferase n=1 Tax=Cryptosporangium sp. NPDC051539 TaxID=3363962 RepID=UPI0037BB982D
MRWWHIEEIGPIERDLFGDEEWSPGMFWSELAQPDTRWYRVAVEDDEVIGYAGLCVYGPEDAWVQNVAVRRDRQGSGLGRRMLDELLDEAVRRGARQVLLEVRADNGPAQRLYARRGFEAVGLRRGYYQPSGTDAVVMQWEARGE